MSNQRCTCGSETFTELVITKNFDVCIEADGFADLGDAKSVYPEPSYLCQNTDCGLDYILEKGILVRPPEVGDEAN